jgi:hypothetical protein
MRRSSFEPQFDISRVRRHVETWVAGCTERFWDRQVLAAVQNSLETGHVDTPRLKGQVRRVLDAMADQGELHKEKEGGFGQSKNFTYFYPIAAWREKVAQDEAEERRERETRERIAAGWEWINTRLNNLGFTSSRSPTIHPHLSPASWNDLLALIEKKKQS